MKGTDTLRVDSLTTWEMFELSSGWQPYLTRHKIALRCAFTRKPLRVHTDFERQNIMNADKLLRRCARTGHSTFPSVLGTSCLLVTTVRRYLIVTKLPRPQNSSPGAIFSFHRVTVKKFERDSTVIYEATTRNVKHSRTTVTSTRSAPFEEPWATADSVAGNEINHPRRRKIVLVGKSGLIPLESI